VKSFIIPLICLCLSACSTQNGNDTILGDASTNTQIDSITFEISKDTFQHYVKTIEFNPNFTTRNILITNNTNKDIFVPGYQTITKPECIYIESPRGKDKVKGWFTRTSCFGSVNKLRLRIAKKSYKQFCIGDPFTPETDSIVIRLLFFIENDSVESNIEKSFNVQNYR